MNTPTKGIPAAGGGKPKQDIRRTAALGGAAGLLAIVFLVKIVAQSGSNPAENAANGGKHPSGKESPTWKEDHRPAIERYKPIVESDPFKERTFTRRKYTPDGKPMIEGGSVATPTSGSYSGPIGPSLTSLRFTGIVLSDAGFMAVFEDRSTGKGVFLKKGSKVGMNEVADVTTSGVIFVPAGTLAKLPGPTATPKPAPGPSGTPQGSQIDSKTAPTVNPSGVADTNTGSKTGAPVASPTVPPTTLSLGDKLELKPEDATKLLVPLGPPMAQVSPSPGSSSSGFNASKENLPTLTADQQTDVLAKLKAKRAASMGNK